MDVFGQRRHQLMEEMGGGIAIVPSAPVCGRNGDVEYDYRQSSDFFYLTGFDEPDSVAVIRPNDKDAPFTLFVRPHDPERAIWDGPRAGVDGACGTYGADQAFPVGELDKKLPELFDGSEILFYTPGENTIFDNNVFSLMRRHRTQPRKDFTGPDKLVDLTSLLHASRLIKSPEEIALLREAGDITSQGHREAMRIAAPGLWEYQVEAVLEFVFRAHGSPRNGYPSIVAAGDHSTILHYNTNRGLIHPGDLLLIDAGCEVGYYTADVTRTFPVDGRFTGPQRDVYDIVLRSQKMGIEKAHPGGSILEVHEVCRQVLVEGMIELGLLEGSVEERIADESYKRFYMHRTSHWLGMDVHDVGAYRLDGKPRPFVEGMVLTIEPGLYIAPDDTTVNEKFRGIGVRIEDDILVTKDGPVILTEMAPKEIDEVEEICQSDSRFVDVVPALGG